MFYTLDGAVKVTGLSKSALLRALECGLTNGTKDLFDGDRAQRALPNISSAHGTCRQNWDFDLDGMQHGYPARLAWINQRSMLAIQHSTCLRLMLTTTPYDPFPELINSRLIAAPRQMRSHWKMQS